MLRNFSKIPLIGPIRNRHVSKVLNETLLTPLSTPIPGFENYKTVTAGETIELFNSKITKLSNGLTVATERAYGTFCTIGVAVNSGCRYETFYPQGTTHLLQKLAFSSSLNYSDPGETEALISRGGALLDCQSTRDCFLYASSCFQKGQEDILSIIADTLHRPCLEDHELEGAKDIAASELNFLLRNPDPEPLINDWLHMAAFKLNTLGISKFANGDSVDKITKQDLYTYMSQYHAPGNMVIAGVGVDHDSFVASVNANFVEKVPIWESDKSLLKDKVPRLDDSFSQYTGGSIYKEADLSNKGLSIVEFPELTHFALGFDGTSFKSKDFVVACVMQSILGGGKSFSAGGPGKGMYTRLYMNVLRYNGSMYNAQAFNYSYADGGAFCIQIGDNPNNMTTAVDYTVNEFIQLTRGIPDDELSRAKHLLKSQLLMNLEQRPVMFEDLARQVLGHGVRKSPLEYIREIEAVTSEDIKRLMENMLNTIPTVVAYGNLKNMPSYEDICARIQAGRTHYKK
uniref:Mitochondrial-processing peptidase subunit alpha n=1 Tax=Rhabditophanes sp. KR3021 TaxID=114890 RepID=A0AC35TVM0_9BILA